MRPLLSTLSLSLSLSCSSGSGSGSGSGSSTPESMAPADDTEGDTASENWSDLQAKMGCTRSLDAIQELRLEPTEITTVHRLIWSADEAIDPSLAIDIGRESPLSGPASGIAALEGERLLLGIPAMTPANAMLMVENDGGLACSDVLDVEAGSIDPSLPELTLSSVDPELAEGGYTALNLITEESSYLVILDEQAEYVWVQDLGSIGVARVAFTPDHQSMVHLSWAPSAAMDGAIIQRGLDGEIEREIPVQGIHTDFTQLPDGGYLALSWDPRTLIDDSGEERHILGDRVLEVSAEGEIRQVWTAYDHYEPDLDEVVSSGGFGGPELEDWTHVNGISYDPKNDDLLVTIYRMNTVLRIERETGNHVWELAKSGGDFTAVDGEVLVNSPHSVHDLGDDRLLLFNLRGSKRDHTSKKTQCSEALEIQLDPETASAHSTWRYISDDCLRVVFFGEAHRLDGGNTMVVFSSSGQVSEATPDGQTVWQVNTDVGGAFGFGARIPSLY